MSEDISCFCCSLSKPEPNKVKSAEEIALQVLVTCVLGGKLDLCKTHSDMFEAEHTRQKKLKGN